MSCGLLTGQLAPNASDLVMRRHFLSAKAVLTVAAVTNQPHLLWNNAAEHCTAYFRALDERLETPPAESIEPNATAAYSMAGQFLSRLLKIRAVTHYAYEVSQLVEAAMSLASRLPSTFVSRMWTSLMPGIDAGVLFRHMGAVAECHLQTDRKSLVHAERGMTYIDEILSQSADQPTLDTENILQVRAELLLLSGRFAEASEQAVALEDSSDLFFREYAVTIKARCQLNTGQPELAVETLAAVTPTADQALDRWRATWMGDNADGYWATQTNAYSPPEDSQVICRLLSLAADDAADMPAFLGAASQSTGFLADSLFQDRQKWADRMRTVVDNGLSGSNRVRMLPTEPPATIPAVVDIDPMAALDEIFPQLVDGAALVQVIKTQEGILTWVARKKDGDVSVTVAPDRPNANRLAEAHKPWAHAYFNFLRHGAAAPEFEAKAAAVFSGLMDEVGSNWGDLLQGLVDDGVTQLVFVGDDLVDIPLHAVPTGSGKERLIDRVPVTYVPSLGALHACIIRKRIDESERKGVALKSMINSDLDSAVAIADALAATLETKSCNMASGAASFWTDVAAAQVLHVDARTTHHARLPFDSVIGAGWLDLSIAELIAGLNLPHCEFVSNVPGESVFPSLLRAPGFDLAAVFLAAGARNVLSSTWVVNNELAFELTQAYFKHWVSGSAPAEAFQQALRHLRTERPALADFHWAGMRLVGAP